MSVFTRAGRRSRLPRRGRTGRDWAGSGGGTPVRARILAAAASGLILVSALAATATASAAPPGAARASVTAARGDGSRVQRPGAGRAPAGPATLSRARGAAPALAAEDVSGGNLQYHGGPVQHDPTFYAIFWLPSGTSYEPGIVNGDSGYENLMTRYLKDAGGTSIASVGSQYFDYDQNGIAQSIGASSRYASSWTDTTPYPESTLSRDDIQGALNAALAANPTWRDEINSTFFVFTGYGVNSCLDSNSCTPGVTSSTPECGFHQYFLSGRDDLPVVYAVLPEDQSWAVTCETTGALPNGDIYADHEFTTLAHEQWEAETNPELDAWSTGTGQDDEIADLCDGQWGYSDYFGPSNTNVNGHLYLLQELWSNADGGCAGMAATGETSGYYADYGAFSATAGASTGALNLALTRFVPSVGVPFTPNPTVNWDDGTSSTAGGTSGCFTCTLTGSHTYAYSSFTGYPVTYDVKVTYYTGFAVSYTQALHVVVFAPPPVPLTISADNQFTYYGVAAADLTVSYSGFVDGDNSSVVQGLTCTPVDRYGNPVSTTTPVGTYSINCGGAVASHYVITYVPGILTIQPWPFLTVTAINQKTTYGAISYDRSPNSMTFGGFVNREGPSVLGSGLAITSHVTSNTPVGSYPLIPGGASDRNYTSITYRNGTLTVNPAALVITANNKSMTHGGPVPAFDASYAGLVNGDAPSALSGLTCGALDANGNPVSSATPAGTYTIRCSGATDSNYAISYQPGTLTLTGP